MGVDVVAPLFVRFRGGLGQRPFDAGRQHHVIDPAAHGADDVMMVHGELFGELVAGDVVGRGDPVDGTALLQDGEVAVQRAL